MVEKIKSPKVFISYAWEDDVKVWVRDLATLLQSDGVETILDQWNVALGDSLPEFMENSVNSSDFVLVVCTPAYKRKSDSSDPSGVGYEKGVITGELFVRRNQRKFIPVLRKGKWLEAAPSWALGKTYIDLEDNPLNKNNYQELLRTLYGQQASPPPLGTPPDFLARERDGSYSAQPGVDSTDIDLYKFIKIPATKDVPYSFYIGKYPVTNTQYMRFVNSSDVSDKSLWIGFPEYNDDCIQVGRWEEEGWNSVYYDDEVGLRPVYVGSKDDGTVDEVREKFNPPIPYSFRNLDHLPDQLKYIEKKFSDPENPVVDITWFAANAYCKWLFRHWAELPESSAGIEFKPRQIRLPIDTEWTVAAGGMNPKNRFPWDLPGKVTKLAKEIKLRANLGEHNINHTTPVNAYPLGASPFGVMDMAGNIREFQANYRDIVNNYLAVRGGSWGRKEISGCVGYLDFESFDSQSGNDMGFRIVCIA